MKELLKTVKKPVTKKAAPKTAKAKATFVPEKGSPYRRLAKDHALFSAFTIAAFVHAGMLGLTAKGAPTAKDGDFDLWKKIVGSTAAPYWSTTGRIENSRLTAKGLNAISSRLDGTARDYKTDRDQVKKMLTLLKSGGTIIVKGAEIPINIPL